MSFARSDVTPCRCSPSAVVVQDNEELRQLEDAVAFAAAQEQQPTVVTYNRNDFLAIHNEYAQREQEHHGLVLLDSRRFPQRQPAAIGQIIGGLARLAQTLATMMAYSCAPRVLVSEGQEREDACSARTR